MYLCNELKWIDMELHTAHFFTISWRQIFYRIQTLWNLKMQLFGSFWFKVILITCFVVPIIFLSPFPIALQITKVSNSSTETMGYWTLNDIGKTLWFRLYSVIILFIEFVLPVLTLCFNNLISWVKFRNAIKRKKRIKGKQDRVIDREANIRFTKMILVLTLICIVTRFIDAVIAIFYRIKLFFELQFSDESTALLELFRVIGWFLLFTAHALDGLIYFFYDINFRNAFKN